ncbi:glycerate kinase [Vibrio sp. Of7-15]|uniref:glycerate kinase type-2 family protein n=1 Tax=Vibrio sp. Of7-15 TaxID=2724879 RepID=UPI001EF33E71|nr:glycerate kinase [Vibrio sp. Of7-15]MCG7495455.1 glycerate kinase [Vibrio sp. Of7-15]
MNIEPSQLLLSLFECAVEEALPQGHIAPYLPEDTTGKAVVIGAGKAAASMAAELEAVWQGELEGVVVTRYGHTTPCKTIEVIEAAHPVPDTAGKEVGERILSLVSGLTDKDVVICLMSGGGSALLSLPAPGISLSTKQAINKALLKSGAAIDEMNCVRKHLSAIKGGRLAKAVFPAKLISLAISDVPGDDPSVIASGPTVADPTTRFEALAILERYQIDISPEVFSWLNNPESETVKEGDACLDNSEFHIIATPQSVLEASAKKAESLGIPAHILSDCMEGEAKDVAKVHAALAKQIAKYNQPFSAPCVLISGGETTVTVTGNGRGGRNSEFLLSLFNELKGHAQIYALAADTDGIDGVEDNAGALITPSSFQQSQVLGLKAQDFLDNNDGYHFFSHLNGLVTTGPTLTNVNDFRAILILPS